MLHYLYVTDIEGREIPGSRRSLDRVTSRRHVKSIDDELTAQIGDGCTIEDNVGDWHAFWAAREGGR